ncbi:MAG: hypothetical protein LOD92_00335 [Bacillales bacterium]
MTMVEIIFDLIEKNGPISLSALCKQINQLHLIEDITYPVDVSDIKAIISRKTDLFSVKGDLVSIRKDMDFLSLSFKISDCQDPAYTVYVDFKRNYFYVFECFFVQNIFGRKPRTVPIGSVEEFKKELYQIKIWNWEKDYQPETLVLGGTIWSVKLKTKGMTFISKGLQTFPNEWDRFIKALSRLTGICFS